MNDLGEKIYELRTKKNMSQGDLADALLVSRQSVSKWETNSSVPDLDKIIRLSEIFEVSLDELVMGNETRECVERETVILSKKEIKNNEKEVSSLQRHIGIIAIIIGIIISAIIFLGGKGIAPILSVGLPFIMCGAICLKKRKLAGLWCVWTVFSFVNYHMSRVLGIGISSIKTVLNYYISYIFRGDSEAARVIEELWRSVKGIEANATVITFILFIALTMATIFYYYKERYIKLSNKQMVILFFGWLLWIMVNPSVSYCYFIMKNEFMINVIALFGSFVEILFFEILMVISFCAMRRK